jgi:hypothetical protein
MAKRNDVIGSVLDFPDPCSVVVDGNDPEVRMEIFARPDEVSSVEGQHRLAAHVGQGAPDKVAHRAIPSVAGFGA